VERWVQKAEKYRSYAQRSLEEGGYDFACFLAQQSAEFLLKGVLIREAGARPLTHSLHEMARRLAQVRAVELSEDVAK
jgi:HEPN domain-containing protein